MLKLTVLQEVAFREHPRQVLLKDGEPFLLLKGSLASLQVDNPVFDGIGCEIIEVPPEGRQRKPRKYISVRGWMALYEHALKVYLQERAPDEEIVTPWPWYGVWRANDMLDSVYESIFEHDLIDSLIDAGYMRVPAKGEATILQYDYILTEKGRAAGWLRYRMQMPSPFGKWMATVVVDMSHIGFAAFIDNGRGHAESTLTVLLMIIQAAHEEREQAWRKRHPWIVAMREYEAAAEAASEDEDDFDLETIMQAHPGAFESTR